MAKILKINDTTVTIGLDDGGLREVRPSDCTEPPVVGMEVDVFGDESSVVVTPRIQPQAQPNPSTTDANGGININISNEAGTNAGGVQYVKAGKVVNKWIYLILAFFLGGIGAHKFYAGKIGAGICYLIFCWTAVPGIIACFDFVIACFKPADANSNIIL